MSTFIRAQLASAAATVIDFSVTITLVELLHCWYVPGAALGTIAGGITHFMLGRHWVFNAVSGRMRGQAIKYVMVWIVYLILTTFFVWAITHYLGLNYLISKAGVSVVMSVCYNYVLHKKFVFK